ncbi:MAG TPA: phenylalanine--tRNA ligase beta subunit-related protein [Bacteroidales bacterium]|nr:phenylalanine--tRNA ligase beta subunit-related protein [Bacteroidales bacterium]
MNSIEVKIGKVIRDLNPLVTLGIIEGKVTNSSYNAELWNEIQNSTTHIRQSLSFEAIKDQPQVAATRKMYSLCGKDPSRYRPSAEALMRRIVKGQDLYQINTLVDIINLVSLKTGFSIGGFDAAYIEGTVELSMGRADEIYNGIGRGLLNIENLPVLRDSKGPIGNPTSDEERTSIRPETTHILWVIYAFAGTEHLQQAMDYACDMLKLHAGAGTMKQDLSASQT